MCRTRFHPARSPANHLNDADGSFSGVHFSMRLFIETPLFFSADSTWRENPYGGVDNAQPRIPYENANSSCSLFLQTLKPLDIASSPYTVLQMKSQKKLAFRNCLHLHLSLWLSSESWGNHDRWFSARYSQNYRNFRCFLYTGLFIILFTILERNEHYRVWQPEVDESLLLI